MYANQGRKVPLGNNVSQEIFAFALRSSRSVSDFEKLICGLLRGDDVVWPYGGNAEAASRFVASARFNGMLPLLDRRFMVSPSGWPGEIVAACRTNALFEAAIELAR